MSDRFGVKYTICGGTKTTVDFNCEVSFEYGDILVNENNYDVAIIRNKQTSKSITVVPIADKWDPSKNDVVILTASALL